jgi:hypothetical protein
MTHVTFLNSLGEPTQVEFPDSYPGVNLIPVLGEGQSLRRFRIGKLWRFVIEDVADFHDTTPNEFNFVDVVGAAISTQYTSNTITVAGLESGVSTAAIIAGGTYSKNNGAYTSSAGTAQNGDTFAVRHTSSSSNSTVTNTTLTIGGVSNTFTTTTLIEPVSPEFIRAQWLGVPRENAPYWVEAEYDETANFYRFTLKADGIAFRTVEQAEPVLTGGMFSAAEVGKSIALSTVEASADGGTTYGPAQLLERAFVFDAEYITPAAIEAPTVVRTSGSDVIPAQFTVSHPDIHPSYMWHYQIFDEDAATLLYDGWKGVSPDELINPMTAADWSGNSDPVPAPGPPPELASGNKFRFRLASQDYVGGFDGMVSDWSDTINVTDPIPVRALRLRLGRTQYENIVIMKEIEAYAEPGGPNLFAGKTAWASSSAAGGNDGPEKAVDGNLGNNWVSAISPAATGDVTFYVTSASADMPISFIRIHGSGGFSPLRFAIDTTTDDPAGSPTWTERRNFPYPGGLNENIWHDSAYNDFAI